MQQNKQKFTFYLSPELHRRLKIRSAMDSQPMSELAERALVFYLANPDLVDELESSYGRTHTVYECPNCQTSLVIRDGDLVSLGTQPGIIPEHLPLDDDIDGNQTRPKGEEELVPC